MNNKEKGKIIRAKILYEVTQHPKDLTKHISKLFKITPQAANRHIKRLEIEGWLDSTGTGRGKRYYPGDLRGYQSTFELTDGFYEDQVWRDHYAFIFVGIPENITDICYYGFTEMVNNAIDHSTGKKIDITVARQKDFIMLFVVDDGEGIFKRIKRVCGLADETQAIFELAKGKLTTDPERHTGEGIFFTSRSFDRFDIDSGGLRFSHNIDHEDDFLFDSDISIGNTGTAVGMLILRDSDRLISEVFDAFTTDNEEPRFSKTVIPVRLAQYENEKLISRSQAKRILTRVEKFEKVILDFEEVNMVGQAFADEIFRVYARRHPTIALTPINMVDQVRKMVMKAVTAFKDGE